MADDGKPATRSLAMLQHGGRLNQAARKYAIEADAWLDLSTGINPLGACPRIESLLRKS